MNHVCFYCGEPRVRREGPASRIVGGENPSEPLHAWQSHATCKVEVLYTLDADAAPDHVLRGGRERISAGAVPDHVLRIARLAERALDAFAAGPLRLLTPAGTSEGKPLVVRLMGLDPAGPSDLRGETDPQWDHIVVDRDLEGDAALLTLGHEVFHRIQYAYNATIEAGQGFYAAMREGGARLAEECVLDSADRYVADGYLDMPARPLVAPTRSTTEPHSYSAGLFWKYVCEQHGKLAEGPGVPAGFDAYVRVLEETSSAQGAPYLIRDLRRARARMVDPGDFDRFLRLDGASGSELISTETTWGNFLVANWLHGTADPALDRRFNYQEDGDGGGRLASRSARLAKTVSLPDAAGAPIQFRRGSTAPMPPYSASYYLVGLGGPAAPRSLLRLRFEAGDGMMDPLVQILLLGPNDRLADLIRLDTTCWARTVNCVGLERILVVVSTREQEGSFCLTLQEDAGKPLVSATRWNCDAGDSYEFDPHQRAWTYRSPDLGFERINGVSRVRLRVRNTGDMPARRVTARLTWQPGGDAPLDASRWMPACMLEGGALEAGDEVWFEALWEPPGGEQDFVLRAQLVVEQDPNEDNKVVIGTFGRVVLPAFP